LHYLQIFILVHQQKLGQGILIDLRSGWATPWGSVTDKTLERKWAEERRLKASRPVITPSWQHRAVVAAAPYALRFRTEETLLLPLRMHYAFAQEKPCCCCSVCTTLSHKETLLLPLRF